MTVKLIVEGKDPDNVKSYLINWLPFIEDVWQPNRKYAVGVFIRPVVRNGFEYEVTTAGESFAEVPVFPTTAGETVTQGQLVLTCRANNDQAIDPISTSFFEATGCSIGDGVTTTAIDLVGTVTPAAKANDDTTATVTIYGGTANTNAEVTNRILTVNNKVYDQTLIVPIGEG